MSLLHKVRHQRLRNWIILAVVLLLTISIVSPMQLGVTLYKLSLVSIAAIRADAARDQLRPTRWHSEARRRIPCEPARPQYREHGTACWPDQRRR